MGDVLLLRKLSQRIDMSAWGGARVQLLRPRLVLKDLVRLHLCQTFSQLFVCFLFCFSYLSARLGHRPRFTQNRTMTTKTTQPPPRTTIAASVPSGERWPDGSELPRGDFGRNEKTRKNLQAKWYQRNTERRRGEPHGKLHEKRRLEIYSVPVVAPPEGTLRRSTTIL